MKVKLDPGSYLPTRAHATDAGLDLYSTEDKTVWPLKGKFEYGELSIHLSGGTTFDTGVHIAFDPGTYGKIESKSGLNVKHSVVSCGGVRARQTPSRMATPFLRWVSHRRISRRRSSLFLSWTKQREDQADLGAQASNV